MEYEIDKITVKAGEINIKHANYIKVEIGGINKGNCIELSCQGINYGTIEGDACFRRNATNYGTIKNTGMFSDKSINHGTIEDRGVFFDNSINKATVEGEGAFWNKSMNEGTVKGNCRFDDQSINKRTVEGNGFFVDNSKNNGTVKGKCRFACNSINYGNVMTEEKDKLQNKRAKIMSEATAGTYGAHIQKLSIQNMKDVGLGGFLKKLEEQEKTIRKRMTRNANILLLTIGALIIACILLLKF